MGDYIVRPVTVADYRRLAKRRLPRFLFDYIDGGANNEETLAANESDFRQIHLRQRVLRDVSHIDTSTVLSGRKVAMPLVLAPVGLAGMMARRAEVQAAKAAAAVGVPFALSTVSICSVEEIQNAVSDPVWFQLYMLRDRGLVVSLLEQARALGCETLVFTVDLAAAGLRHRDLRGGMLGSGLAYQLSKIWQLASHPRWLLDVGLMGRPHRFGNLTGILGDARDLVKYKEFVGSQFDASVTWKDIAWLRTQWSGTILIKGVMSADDAEAALTAGANGVIVSNHGGRQLDGVASTISKLPEVVARVGDRMEVYMDGGIRSGNDVIRAVALGAKGVLIGRPWIWAVAAGGEQGLTDLLDVYQREMAVAMALMGVTRIDELTPDVIDTTA